MALQWIEIINNAATNIVKYTGLQPLEFFVIGGIISAAIILFNSQSQYMVSLDIPGNTQLGLAGAILISSAIISSVAGQGVQNILTSFRGDIITGVVIAAIFAFYQIR